jgi:hypothetical protein
VETALHNISTYVNYSPTTLFSNAFNLCTSLRVTRITTPEHVLNFPCLFFTYSFNCRLATLRKLIYASTQVCDSAFPLFCLFKLFFFLCVCWVATSVFVEVLVKKSVSHKSYRLCILHPVRALYPTSCTGSVSYILYRLCILHPVQALYPTSCTGSVSYILYTFCVVNWFWENWGGAIWGFCKVCLHLTNTKQKIKFNNF